MLTYANLASAFLLTIFVTNCLSTPNAAVLKNVTIQKCCAFDEHTIKNATCVPGEREGWIPKIYSPRKKKYLPTGTTPTNWHLKPSQRPDCRGGSATTFSTNPTIVFENGSLFVLEYDKLVRPDKYCIDYNTTLFCLEEVQQTRPLTRVKKCCGEGALYKDTKKSCITMKGSDYKIDLDENKTLVAGFPVCDGHMVIASKLHEAVLQENGSLLLQDQNIVLPAGEFCVEHVLENAGQSASVFTCHSYLPPTVTISSSNVPPDLRFTLYPIGLALSAVFLAATLAAGSLLPASHHVLHWRCQTNHVVCLLVGYTLLCITQIAGRSMSTIPCFIIAVAMHFLFLAAFFWLNTMCFNIWWTFRRTEDHACKKVNIDQKSLRHHSFGNGEHAMIYPIRSST